jgi:predicted transcriptional regulator
MIISAAAAEQKIHNDLIGSRLSGLTQKNEQDHQWILKRALRNQQSREQILQANKYNTNSAIFWVAI